MTFTLIDIISEFPKLERFVVRNNKDIEEIQVKEMKNKIKERYGRELEIV